MRAPSPRLSPRDLRCDLAVYLGEYLVAGFLEGGEVLVLAAPVLKRRHLSVKRRQLLLADGEVHGRSREIDDGLHSRL